MHYILSLFLLVFSLSAISDTKPLVLDNSNNKHLKQSFRYAKDVNPVDFLKLDPRVIEMIGGVAQFCKKHNITFMITSAIRSPERNKAVGGQSVTHVEGRAIDFSIKKYWGWNDKLIKDLEKYIEQRYGEYGLYGPFKKQKVIVIHKVKGGALHAHIQVTRMANDTYTNTIMDNLVNITKSSNF